MMIAFFRTLILRRIQKSAIVEYFAPPLIGISGVLGGIMGFNVYLKNEDGMIWRTSMGCIIGASTGLVLGLYPYQSAVIIIMTDIAYTVKKKIDR